MSNMTQMARRFVPRKLHPHLGGIRRKLIANPVRIELQRRRLLKSKSLNQHQRALLENVNTQIHYRDGMYAGSAEDYFAAGLSAVECVNEVLPYAKTTHINDVLDLPSGYGRELRFLLLRFPEAKFTACDVQPGAVDFCASAFGALPVYSKPDIAQVSFQRKFDLIWCGSLITHLDQSSTRSLLEVFAAHLNPNGVMIVTTNGDFVAAQMRDGATYDLTTEIVRELAATYAETGYAYSDYARGLGYFEFHPEGHGYGVSLMSPSWFRSLAENNGLKETYFAPRRWAKHQDVFAFHKG